MIEAHFFTSRDAITRITLRSSSSGGAYFISGDAKRDLRTAIDAWMACYLAGRQPTTTLPLDLNGATPFNRLVWRALSQLPFGKLVSYKELAELAGSPKAARAVGNACNKNPFPLVIPCHRVVSANQTLGGFAFGCDTKLDLLAHEGWHEDLGDGRYRLRRQETHPASA